MNKRRSPRSFCHVPVDGQEGGLFDRTQTVDFSKGGLGFISPKQIPLNKRITIELNLTTEDNPVFVVGKVKWVKSLPVGHHYRVGLCFENILKGSKFHLNKYFITDPK